MVRTKVRNAITAATSSCDGVVWVWVGCSLGDCGVLLRMVDEVGLLLGDVLAKCRGFVNPAPLPYTVLYLVAAYFVSFHCGGFRSSGI